VWPDGSVHWLYDKGRAHAGDDGTPRYMTGACVDVTERRRKEDALLEADRQKDEFIGVLAHELRSPLASLVFAVASLDRRLADPTAVRPLQVMSRQIARITRLVDDLLDVSRVAQGKIVLERQRVDLAALLRDAIEVARPGLSAHGHTIEAALEDGLVIAGDADRLGQVFENLLANAVKYTPDGGRIVVRLRRDGESALTSVRDSGIGIDPDMLPQIFGLFVQADGSSSRSQGGLGIGLTLVDRLTRLHGGSVAAYSDGLEQGAEFVVSLPLAGVDAVEPLLLGDECESLA
jgi:signal transduction histidine kinase